MDTDLDMDFILLHKEGGVPTSVSLNVYNEERIHECLHSFGYKADLGEPIRTAGLIAVPLLNVRALTPAMPEEKKSGVIQTAKNMIKKRVGAWVMRLEKLW